MLHDARSDDIKDLLDDEFNRMLSGLYAKTHNITVVLDSCNSGTATRGDSEYIARFFDPPADTPQYPIHRHLPRLTGLRSRCRA